MAAFTGAWCNRMVPKHWDLHSTAPAGIIEQMNIHPNDPTAPCACSELELRLTRGTTVGESHGLLIVSRDCHATCTWKPRNLHLETTQLAPGHIFHAT